MIAAIMLLASQTSGQNCDLAAIRTARAVYERLARRAIEVVVAASAKGTAGDAQLHRLVEQSANFSLGASDVGMPLGIGPTGARALAVAMKADQYRFLGWDYMDGPADGCSKQSIEIEFVNSGDRRVSKVEFNFDQGRLIGAKGWEHSFESGILRSPKSP